MIATIAFVLLIISQALQGVWLFKAGNRERVSPWVSLGAGLLLVVTIIQRSIAIRFFALTNLYESLLFLAMLASSMVFGLRKIRQSADSKALPFAINMIAIVFLAIASSPLAPSDIRPPVPALQSGWLILHVSFTFIGEIFFAVGLVTAILQLVATNEESRRRFDRLTYTSIAIGYPIFTAGALVFGAIWAENAWGRWWGWDPKETWALITWLTYTAYLHFRLVRKNTSKLMPALVILGFLIAMFTFFGVNFLLKGLHSYA